VVVRPEGPLSVRGETARWRILAWTPGPYSNPPRPASRGHLQNPRCLAFFQAAMRHCLAALYQSGMHPYRPAVPWVPVIADLTDIPNMGVLLLSCMSRIGCTTRWQRTHRRDAPWSNGREARRS
jgi:hypothetical protein